MRRRFHLNHPPPPTFLLPPLKVSNPTPLNLLPNPSPLEAKHLPRTTLPPFLPSPTTTTTHTLTRTSITTRLTSPLVISPSRSSSTPLCSSLDPQEDQDPQPTRPTSSPLLMSVFNPRRTLTVKAYTNRLATTTTPILTTRSTSTRIVWDWAREVSVSVRESMASSCMEVLDRVACRALWV